MSSGAGAQRQRFERFLLFSGQVAGIFQPHVAALLQCGLCLLFLAPDLVNGFVEQFDNIEFVEGDLAIGQVRFDPDDEGR